MSLQVAKMLELVRERHEGQVDKAGVPYFAHCLAVLRILEEEAPKQRWAIDDDLRCIALGHDLLEDGGFADKREFSVKLYSEGASMRVAEAIRALSKNGGVTMYTPERYFDQVASNPDARIVKICDLLHNMQMERLPNPAEKDWERHGRYQTFLLGLGYRR